MSITLTIPDTEAMHRFGLVLGQNLPASSIVLLEGELGSGKTTLVQGIGAGLGITSSIDSPTFTLINEYLEGRLPLYHLDLYRLQPPEIAALHPETYWEGIEFPSGIVAVEWADRLPYSPPSYLRICLTHTTTDSRQAAIATVGECELPVLPGTLPSQ